MRRHGLLGPRQRGVDGADVGQQFQPGGGGPGAAADPLDQLQAEAALELAHLQADGGLGDAAAFGGSRETAQFDHLRKGAQGVQIESAHGIPPPPNPKFYL